MCALPSRISAAIAAFRTTIPSALERPTSSLTVAVNLLSFCNVCRFLWVTSIPVVSMPSFSLSTSANVRVLCGTTFAAMALPMASVFTFPPVKVFSSTSTVPPISKRPTPPPRRSSWTRLRAPRSLFSLHGNISLTPIP
uniref:Secreted protein n=1 Tax=Panagrellus redivivus TaxID=6233 RepID=A0A7E4V836_PANRE